MSERDTEKDLELCNAATPGPWESVSGYSVREPEDERGYGPIIANMDCKEHSVEQMVYNACFICESREALPYWIRRCQAVEAELAQSRREYAEEIDEFNAGYQAAKDGLPESAEPEHCPHDVWLCGYAWGAFEGMKAELDRLRAENARLREQSEESALSRLRAWVQQREGFRTAVVSVEGCQDAEMLELIDICHPATNKREVVVVWNKPIDSDKPNHVGIGTEDSPASLGEMVDAALARWAELYGEGLPLALRPSSQEISAADLNVILEAAKKQGQ